MKLFQKFIERKENRKMDGGESKTNWWLIFGILIFAFIIVMAIISFFSTPSETVTSKKGLEIKFFGNRSLKSGSYLEFNSTIKNVYDISLNQFQSWLESGSLFQVSNLPLSNLTTLKSFGSLEPGKSVHYFFGNIKVASVTTSMKNIPIYLKLSYLPNVAYNLTVNVARNDSVANYGGTSNMGIFYKKMNSPISLSLNFKNEDFVYGKKNYSPFEITLTNSGEGECSDKLNVIVQANDKLSCKINNAVYSGSFQFSTNFTKSLKIPCNYTLDYLKNKDFDSFQIKIYASCKYVESKKFTFDIIPA